MPSPADVAHQFDSIEDTIAAFSECSFYSNFHLLYRGRTPLARHSNSSRQLTVTQIGNGEFIIVLDSQDRENEGDLIIAAESITAAQMAFLVRYTR
jgi:3,4-dihydroxy 2-butanone 4-phosphate synthase